MRHATPARNVWLAGSTAGELFYQGNHARGIVCDFGPEAGTNVQLDVSKQIAKILRMVSAGKVDLVVIVIYQPKPPGQCK